MTTPINDATTTPPPASSRARRGELRLVDAAQTSAAALFDAHGRELHLLACVLTDDPGVAEQMVASAIAEHEGGPDTFRELAAAAYLAWAVGPTTSTTVLSAFHVSDSAAVLHDLHGLPDAERAALALCRFGGHDHRQAAATLAIAPADVARLLTAGLRHLAVPRSPRGVAGISPAASPAA